MLQKPIGNYKIIINTVFDKYYWAIVIYAQINYNHDNLKNVKELDQADDEEK